MLIVLATNYNNTAGTHCAVSSVVEIRSERVSSPHLWRTLTAKGRWFWARVTTRQVQTPEKFVSVQTQVFNLEEEVTAPSYQCTLLT